MGLFDHFPYTNVHELNLDWILTMMKTLEAEWEQFTAGNSLTFADPLQHDISKTYAKNTIVLDGSGNAYVSLQPVPVGVTLDNQDYWLMVFDYEAFIEEVNKNFTSRYYRDQYRATAAMAIGDWLTVDDVLCKATAAIAVDDVLEIGVNIDHFTLEDFIKAFMTSANQMIQQYKNDIDASELLYRQQLAGDIAQTTASLQAQLDAAISGVTVDSEVINARIGADGVTYPTLGDAIRTQIGVLNNMVIDRPYNGIKAVYRGLTPIYDALWLQGALQNDGSVQSTNPYYITTSFIGFSNDVDVYILNPSKRYLAVADYTSADVNDFVSRSDYEITNAELHLSAGHYYKFAFTIDQTTTPITPNANAKDILFIFTCKDNYSVNTFKDGIIPFKTLFVQGAIDGGTGKITTNNGFYITTQFITPESDMFLFVDNPNSRKIAVGTYTSPDVSDFVSRSSYEINSMGYELKYGNSYRVSFTIDGNVTPINPRDNSKDITLNFFKLGQNCVPTIFNNGNLASENIFIDSSLNSGDGTMGYSNSYSCTPFIEIPPSRCLYVGPYRTWVTYDEDKAYIAGSAIETFTTTKMTFNSNVKYVRFNVRTANVDTFKVTYEDPANFSDFNFGFSVNGIMKNHNLADKLIISFGDSLMYGHYSGEGILDGLAADEGFVYVKCAQNGASVIGNLASQITNAPAMQADIIVFNGLTNDAWDTIVPDHVGALSTGYADNFDTTSFYGAFEHVLYLLHDKYPEALYLFICPHNMPSRSANAQAVLQKAARDCCEKWAVPYVDIYQSGIINTCIDYMRIQYSYDNPGDTGNGNGTHLTGAGYNKYYAPPIKEELLTLVNRI